MVLDPPRKRSRTPKSIQFYRSAMGVLRERRLACLIGGGYAMEHYTGIRVPKKDLDIFVLPEDVCDILSALAEAGYHTEVKDSVWLAKAHFGSQFIDVIWSAKNGICRVDKQWFRRSVHATVLDMPLQLCAPEEMIWQKAFLMNRDRYDGADVAHLLLTCAHRLDWPHLLDRFGPQWRVLASHLILFAFIYPGEQSRIPRWITDELLQRLESEPGQSADPTAKICRGRFLGTEQYGPDIDQWGYEDARALLLRQAGTAVVV